MRLLRSLVTCSLLALVNGISNIDLADDSNEVVFNFIGPSNVLFATIGDTAGDFDGDGINDLILLSEETTAYLILGKYYQSLSSTSNSFDLSIFVTSDDTGFLLAYTENVQDVFSANFVGDVNGDGFEDIGIGVSSSLTGINNGAGFVTIIFGKNSSFEDVNIFTHPSGPTSGFKAYGMYTNDECRNLNKIGDVNSDGFSDFLIGCGGIDANETRVDSGAMFLYFGHDASKNFTDIQLSANASTLTDGIVILGEAAGDALGTIGFLGDFNGDGVDDFVIGSSTADRDGLTDVGVAYIVFGKKGIGLTTLDLADFNSGPSTGLRVIGPEENAKLGIRVGGGGDVNGDGLNDVLLGAPEVDSGELANAGAVFVLFGKNNTREFNDLDLSTFAADDAMGFAIYGAASNEQLQSVGRIGNYNGDKYGDIVVGAEQSSPLGRFSAGASYALFGKSSGFSDIFLATFPFNARTGFTIFGGSDFDRCGYTNIGAGDLDQDGFDDFLVSCPVYSTPDRGFAGAVSVISSAHVPTASPSFPPSSAPSVIPSTSPTLMPTFTPSSVPSAVTTYSPTHIPTIVPSANPSYPSTLSPTDFPSTNPTLVSTIVPTSTPSGIPSGPPTVTPTGSQTKLERYVWDMVGTGFSGFNGDDLLGTFSRLAIPYDVWQGLDDLLYIADNANHVIRIFDPRTGRVKVFAGTAEKRGFRGDGAAATFAMMRYPRGVVGDNDNSLYISDTFNHRIRKISLDTTVITTVVGGGMDITSETQTASSVRLRAVVGLFYDRPNDLLYFCDSKNNVLRRFSISDGIVTIIAGSLGAMGSSSGDGGQATSASLSFPFGVTQDTTGVLFFTERDNFCVRKVATDGIISTFAGMCSSTGSSGDGGPATDALFSSRVRGIGLDSAAGLYIADSNNNRIRVVDNNNIITTVVGSGKSIYNGNGLLATLSNIRTPMQLHVSGSGEIIFAEGSGHKIRTALYSSPTLSPTAGPTPESFIPPSPIPTATPTTAPTERKRFVSLVAGGLGQGYAGEGGDATDASLNIPYGVWLCQSGDILIADNKNHRIRAVNKTTNIISTYAGNGVKALSGDGGPATEASLKYPRQVMEFALNVFIADGFNRRIRRVKSGTIETYVGGGTDPLGTSRTSVQLQLVLGMFIDDFTDTSSHQLYFCEARAHVVRKVNLNTGDVSLVAGTLGTAGAVSDVQATEAQLNYPWGVYLDTTGVIYVSERENDAVRKIDSDGILTVFAGMPGTSGFAGDGMDRRNALFDDPSQIWGDGEGNLYVSDTDNLRIRKISPSGIIVTEVGTGLSTWDGQGGSASETNIRTPMGMYVTREGEIYFVEAAGNIVRAALYEDS